MNNNFYHVEKNECFSQSSDDNEDNVSDDNEDIVSGDNVSEDNDNVSEDNDNVMIM